MGQLRPFLSAILLFLGSISAWAGPINITGVSRASNYTINTDGTAKIFAGLAGLVTDCPGGAPASDTAYCNNCTRQNLACSDRRVHNRLILHIDFTVTADLNAPLWFGFSVSGTPSAWSSGSLNLGRYQTATTGNLTKGTTGYIEVRWETICFAAGVTDCDGATAAVPDFKLILGAGTNSTPNANSTTEVITDLAVPDGNPDLVLCADTTPNTGVCKFEARPGDSKVFIRNVETIGTYPTSNGTRLIALRVFYSKDSFDAANYDSAFYKDLTIPDDNVNEPTPRYVDGLENGQLYFFRPAVVDEAYNVAFLTTETEITGSTDSGFTGCGAADDATCGMMAQPDPVFGLLTEDLNCFISTAAFGSQMAPEVNTFRKFRNEFLVYSNFGRKLIKAYYSVGPKFAQVIHTHPTLKPFARATLYPALWYSQLSLKLNSQLYALGIMLTAMAGLISVFGFGFLGVRRWISAKR